MLLYPPSTHNEPLLRGAPIRCPWWPGAEVGGALCSSRRRWRLARSRLQTGADITTPRSPASRPASNIIQDTKMITKPLCAPAHLHMRDAVMQAGSSQSCPPRNHNNNQFEAWPKILHKGVLEIESYEVHCLSAQRGRFSGKIASVCWEKHFLFLDFSTISFWTFWRQQEIKRNKIN